MLLLEDDMQAPTRTCRRSCDVDSIRAAAVAGSQLDVSSARGQTDRPTVCETTRQRILKNNMAADELNGKVTSLSFAGKKFFSFYFSTVGCGG